LPPFFSGPAVPAILALADGTIFKGFSIGAAGHTTGEVVFNTSMTGYQEILTDPSYCRQIVTLTYPHIGNTGVTPEDLEAAQIYPAGLVIRDLPLLASSWRSNGTLSDFLERGKIVAIAGIDTRKLTRILREKGAQSGCRLSASAALVCAGTTVMRQPKSESRRRMFRLMPKSYATTWCGALGSPHS
jgi:carbamoyl-phosphate synthase small subunit